MCHPDDSTHPAAPLVIFRHHVSHRRSCVDGTPHVLDRLCIGGRGLQSGEVQFQVGWGQMRGNGRVEGGHGLEDAGRGRSSGLEDGRMKLTPREPSTCGDNRKHLQKRYATDVPLGWTEEGKASCK